MIAPVEFMTREERDSPLWRRLADHMRAEIEALRTRNEVTTLSEVQTAVIRGRITQLRAVLALGDPPAPPADSGPDDY